MSTEKVLEVMKIAGKKMRTGEIAEAAALDKKVVEKAIKELKEKDLITSPVRCYWEAK